MQQPPARQPARMLLPPALYPVFALVYVIIQPQFLVQVLGILTARSVLQLRAIRRAPGHSDPHECVLQGIWPWKS